MTDDDIIWCAYWPLSPQDIEALKQAAEQRKWDAMPEAEKARSLAVERSFRMVPR